MYHNLLKNLTARQHRAYVMRFRYGWKIQRIAQELGIDPSSAGQLIKRAQLRAGLGRVKVRVIRTKPRRVRAASLSRWDRVT